MDPLQMGERVPSEWESKQLIKHHNILQINDQSID